MKTDKQLTQTALAELVETHNLARALRRLQKPPYDEGRWKRALYHAATMTCTQNFAAKLRTALELP